MSYGKKSHFRRTRRQVRRRSRVGQAPKRKSRSGTGVLLETFCKLQERAEIFKRSRIVHISLVHARLPPISNEAIRLLRRLVHFSLPILLSRLQDRLWRCLNGAARQNAIEFYKYLHLRLIAFDYSFLVFAAPHISRTAIDSTLSLSLHLGELPLLSDSATCST